MRECTNCGEDFDKEETICPHCGHHHVNEETKEEEELDEDEKYVKSSSYVSDAEADDDVGDSDEDELGYPDIDDEDED